MKSGQKVKFKKRNGEVVDATFVNDPDLLAGNSLRRGFLLC